MPLHREASESPETGNEVCRQCRPPAGKTQAVASRALGTDPGHMPNLIPLLIGQVTS